MTEHDQHDTSPTDPAVDADGHPGPEEGRSPAEPYTVHDDADLGAAATGAALGTGTAVDAGAVEAEDHARSLRRPPDPVALVAGLTALLVAVLALTDVLRGVDPGWVVAAVAIGVGGTFLLATLRRRRT